MLLDLDEIQARAALDGGSIFPIAYKVDGEEVQTDGMTMRAYLVAHSPITYEVAVRCFFAANERMPAIENDADRASFFAVWSMLRAEFAEAQLAAMK